MKKIFKSILQKLLLLIILIYGTALVLVAVFKVSKTYVFPHKYSYENIDLYAAEPLNKDIDLILKEVLRRVERSSLYDKEKTYSVCLTNNKKAENIFFKINDIVHNLPNIINGFKKTKKIDLSSTTIDKSLRGYIMAVDYLGIAYIRDLDIETMTHELAHQMVVREINNPLISMLTVKNRIINEGYANLIAHGEKINGLPSSLVGGNVHRSSKLVDHGELGSHNHYIYRVEISNKTYLGKYTVENMMIVENLLEEDDIISLLKTYNIGPRMERESLNILKKFGYEKIEETPGINGVWIKETCSYYGGYCFFDNFKVKTGVLTDKRA